MLGSVRFSAWDTLVCSRRRKTTSRERWDLSAATVWSSSCRSRGRWSEYQPFALPLDKGALDEEPAERGWLKEGAANLNTRATAWDSTKPVVGNFSSLELEAVERPTRQRRIDGYCVRECLALLGSFYLVLFTRIPADTLERTTRACTLVSGWKEAIFIFPKTQLNRRLSRHA